MKRTFYFCLFVLLTITMSCNKNSSEMMKLTAERDSLLNSNKLISDEKNELDAFITEVAECLDSITQQEQILVTNTDNNGH